MLSTAPASDLAIFGVGSLGTSLCRQIIASSDFQPRIVTGITKTNNRHELIRQSVFPNLDGDEGQSRLNLITCEDLPKDAKFKDVVFCIPPFFFEDYTRAVEDVILNSWDGRGSFIFASSGAVYGPGDGETVTETSPMNIDKSNPRQQRLIDAEDAVRKYNGCVLRLGGFYTLEHGVHSYWLETDDIKINGIPSKGNGVLNLVHVDDAASACLAALKVGPSGGETFLISDGIPITRSSILDAALKTKRFYGMEKPKFLGGDNGKVYDGTTSNGVLNWKPVHKSFVDYMSQYE